MKRILSIPIYPILAAATPVLILAAINIMEVSIQESFRPLLISMLAGAFVLWISWVKTNNWHDAALIAFGIILIWNVYRYGFTTTLICILLVIVVGSFSLEYEKFTPTLTIVMNIILVNTTVIICGMILFQAGERDFGKLQYRSVSASAVDPSAPDIYLIIVDSYGGRSVLMDEWGYDNDPFLEELQALGFNTGECPPPGPQTDQSLANILNPTQRSEDQLWKQIRYSEVADRLHDRGYSTIAYKTGYIWNEMINADRYVQPEQHGLNNMEKLNIMITPLILLDGVLFDLRSNYSENRREVTNNLLDHLADPVEMAGPQFTFAHIIQPHPPFVWDADGTELVGEYDFDDIDYRKGYIAQLQYINTRLIAALSEITDQNSVIIVTGDHGPRLGDDISVIKVLCAVRSPETLPLEAQSALDKIINY